MSAARFTRLVSPVAVVPTADVDTDQIIPARFLKTTSRAGLGQHLFADWRERPRSGTAAILLAGPNFGCGSSREHAVWALWDAGFRAVVSSSFADIFRQNALKNGLLPVAIDEAVHRRLLAAPPASLAIDLESCTVTLPDGATVPFPVDPFARRCLLEGIDELGFLESKLPEIEAWERRRAATS